MGRRRGREDEAFARGPLPRLPGSAPRDGAGCPARPGTGGGLPTSLQAWGGAAYSWQGLQRLWGQLGATPAQPPREGRGVLESRSGSRRVLLARAARCSQEGACGGRANSPVCLARCGAQRALCGIWSSRKLSGRPQKGWGGRKKRPSPPKKKPSESSFSVVPVLLR